MPIPVSPGMFLAQVVMRPDSLPDSNSFVNTFFFEDAIGGRTTTQVADDIETVLESFYNTIHGGATGTLASGLSAVIDPPLTTARIYNLGDAVPRVPEIRGMGSWSVGSTALPNEVAAVISYMSGTPTATGGTMDKTRRGRVFIGPLSKDVASLTAGDGDAMIASGYQNILVQAATYLVGNPEDVNWIQHSGKEDRFELVTSGFVNNRFDTQRRRGAEASVRTVWP